MYETIDPMGTRHLSKTWQVRARIWKSTHRYRYENLPADYVLTDGYLVYLIRTRPIVIRIEQAMVINMMARYHTYVPLCQ
jgi:hypothetical protein